MTQAAGGEPQWPATTTLSLATEFACFSEQPAYDDVLLLGLDDAAPSCAIGLRFECHVQGVGVDPTEPPLVWEAWDGTGWVGCEVDRDGTGGLNRPGDVVVHVPRSHTRVGRSATGARGLAAVPRGARAIEGYPFYSASPTITAASAFTIGGTVQAVHAETVTDEVLGLSEGVPGQVFRLARGPGGRRRRRRSRSRSPTGSGWERWQEVDSFAGCDADDPVFRVDRATGDVHFGPAVREPDGTLALLRRGAARRARRCGCPLYRVGGGPAGNVVGRDDPGAAVDGARRWTGSRTGVPRSVASHRETVDEAKLRGPLALRTRDRAVTAEDYEQLARARRPRSPACARCRPAARTRPAGCGCWSCRPPRPTPRAGSGSRTWCRPRRPCEAVADHIEERRTVGARVVVEPPFYQGVTVVATLVARPRTSSEELQREAAARAQPLLQPARPAARTGRGWPFGRPVQAGEVYAVLQRLPGTELVDEVRAVRRRPGHRQARETRCSGSTWTAFALTVLLRPPDPGDPR